MSQEDTHGHARPWQNGEGRRTKWQWEETSYCFTQYFIVFMGQKPQTNKQTRKPRLQQNAAQLQTVFTELHSCSLKHDSSPCLAQSLTVTLLPSDTVVQLSALPVDHLCDLLHLLCHPK